MKINTEEQELEARVTERTAQLARTNEILLREIAERQRSEQQLADLTGRLLRTQDEERRRIARELHDVTAQNVGVILLELAQIQRIIGPADSAMTDKLDQCVSLTEQALKEIRTLSYVLHPPLRDQAGLVTTLQWYVKGFSEQTGLRIGFVDDGNDNQDIDPEVEFAFFRVVQECLTNIRSNSNCETADICLMRNSNELVLQVEDHGASHNVDDDSEHSQTNGEVIKGMEHRLKQLGGTLASESTSEGTIVTARVPLNERVYDSRSAG
jgi:two-component system NarL family sensor kinase